MELIAVLYTECIYEGKVTDIANAIECFTRDVISGMEKPHFKVGAIDFAKA